MRDEGIRVSHYFDGFTSKEKKNGELKEAKNIIIVLNSLHYLSGRNYDIVVCDESETILDKWYGTFMKETKLKNWNVFVNILKNASKVICMDAFITKKTTKFIEALNENNSIRIVQKEDNVCTRTVKYVKNYELMINRLIEDIKAGKKPLIVYPLKKASFGLPSMEELYRCISTETRTFGQFYHADVDDEVKKEIKNINEKWSNYSFVIMNNTITCGVNYDKTVNIFDSVYIFVATICSPRDLVQQSYRVRELESKTIYVTFLKSSIPPTTWNDDCGEMNCPIYKKLYNSIMIEKKSPQRNTLKLFFRKAFYKQIVDKELVNDSIRRNIENLLYKYKIEMPFAGVQNIEAKVAEEIEQKVICCLATMREKYELQKYHFKGTFNENTDILKIECAWNEQYISLFDKMRTVIRKEKTSIFHKIKEFNKHDDIFPYEFKKIKLNEEIKDQIFREFEFKFLNRKSGQNHLLKEIYNTFFETRIVNTIKDNSKNVKFEVDATKWNEWYNFVKENSRHELIQTGICNL